MSRAGIVAALLPLLAAAGCSTTSPDSARDFRPGQDCMFARALRDWRPLDNQNLILFGSGRMPYHVELMRPAFGLTFDFMIGVYDRDGMICPFGGDAIIVDGGGMRERISILNMRRLTDAELDALYIEYGIAPPPVVDSLEPVPGVDTEE